MSNEILSFVKNISLEAIAIGFMVFLLTMVIKWPIKKFTSKLTEEKRKAVNSIIVLIPIILSLIISILYFGIVKNEWLSIDSIQIGFSSWLLSFSIYALYNRFIILVKGIISGKIKINSDLTKEAIIFLKENLKNLSSQLKIDESKLNKVTEKILSLIEIKNLLESDEEVFNLTKLSETNIKIQSLKNEESKLKTSTQNLKSQIESYTQKLYVTKGE